VGARLSVHGAAGATALVPLLASPSEEVRRLASYALDQFETLDARHLSALIAAHRRGLNVVEPIARIGSEEALRYLESGWSMSDEGNPTRWGLPLFGRRAEPFLLRRLELCRQACSRREAEALLYALDRIGPLPETTRAVIRDVASSATEPELRQEMEDQLIHRSDPAALPILLRRLGELRGAEYEDSQATWLLERVGRHRAAARATAGPTILSYLARPELRRARIAAVIASWVADYRPAVPALRALLGEAERDWLLAYHAMAALAELGGREARPEIERLARGHWYRPVRNNAQRALAKLDGGAFALPGPSREERGPYAGQLNFAADVDPVRDCRFDAAATTLRFGREAPVPVRRRGGGAVRVALARPSPEPRATSGDSVRNVTLNWQRGGERIVGIDAERWEGELIAVEANGRRRRILAGDVLAAFATADALLVLTGDSVGNIDEGDLWRLPMGGALAVVGPPLRLPASPAEFALASDGTLLIRTSRGDVALARDGGPLAPRLCPTRSPAPAPAPDRGRADG